MAIAGRSFAKRELREIVQYSLTALRPVFLVSLDNTTARLLRGYHKRQIITRATIPRTDTNLLRVLPRAAQ